MTSSSETSYIAALSLRFFRSHQRFERECGAGLIALVGPNGVGKTNILEAISVLTPGRGLRGASSDEMAMRGNAAGWAVAASLCGQGGTNNLRVAFDLSTGRRSAKINDVAETQTAMARLLRLVWLTPAMDRLWIEGASGRRKYLDRLTLAFDAAHGERSAVYEKTMRERNKLLKEQRFAPPSWFEALELRLAESGLAISKARVATMNALSVSDGSSNLADDTGFPAADLSLEGPLEECVDLDVAKYAERLAADRRGDVAAGRTRFGPHRTDLCAVYRRKNAPAAQCSTGEQKALLLSLTLTAADALRRVHGAPPVLLLDEIAAHLDPARRASLFQTLSSLGAQVWMTGVQAADFDAARDFADIVELEPD